MMPGAGGPYAPPGQAPFPPARPTLAGQGFTVDNSDRNKKIFIGAGIGLVALLLIALLAQNVFPAKVTAPTLSTTWTAKNKSFSISQPDGWAVKTNYNVPGDDSGPSDVDGVLFVSGTASVDVTSDSATKSKAAQLLTSNGPGTDALANPDAQLDFFDDHEKSLVSGRYRNYQEGSVYKFSDDGFGDGIGHTFTADGHAWSLFGGPVKGYRVSLMGGDFTVSIVCECRASDWDTLKNSFQSIISSVQDAGGHTTGGGGLPGMG
jgi:hypothetical protein